MKRFVDFICGTGFLFFALLLSLFGFSACSFDSGASSNSVSGEGHGGGSGNSWTLVVYMAADNALEPDAIADLNEMESAVLPSGMDVLVLLDRAEGYDASNDDWSGTRLFKVRHDSGDSNRIVSERLSSVELGLSADVDTELDMSSKSTLSALLSFARRSCPAENYGLVVWGHGTGWRSGDAAFSRAFAVDEGGGSSSYMTLSDMRQAVAKGLDGDTLSFLGFDTCFGACLESAYEFRSVSSFMVGSPSVEAQSGWDYCSLFNSLSSVESITPENFCGCAMSQFKSQYKNSVNAAFCVLDLSSCQDAVSAFDTFSSNAALLIDSYSARDSLLSVFEKECVSYSSGVPSDFYVDSLDVVRNIAKKCGELYFYADIVEESFSSFVVDSWNSTYGTCSPGVFFASEKSPGVFSTHPDLYVSGNQNPSTSQFVNFATGYVPTKICAGSLLDKLFYTVFDK